jgi:hypothetical protein
MLKERIERLLRNDEPRTITLSHKVLVSSTIGLLILIAVACRNESISLPALGDLASAESQAAAKLAANEKGRDATRRLMARGAEIQAALAMTRADVAQLESEVARTPEDLQARQKLLYFYGGDLRRPLSPEDVEARRRHIIWFIEHHPEHEILANTWFSQLSPLPSAHFKDPDGYAEAKGLWLARIAPDNASTAILSNAARFFEVPDKPLAEKLLLRLQSDQADVRWTVRLAAVYALALVGAVDADDSPAFDERQPVGLGIRTTSESEAKSDFSKSVQHTLAQSKDVQLLYAVGQYLQFSQYLTPHREATAEMGMTYLRRAVDVDPHFVPAHQAYLRVVLSKKQSDLHTMLMKFPQESRFEAVMKLPEAQRFPSLRAMALYSFQEANSLAVLDPQKAENLQDLARAYADELLKLAPRFRNDPDYSGAVFSADILIGWIAARRGDTETAVRFLRDASTVPSSEEMAYFPPSVPYDNLAGILAGSGHRPDVIAFYEHFAQINLSQRDYLLRTAWNLRTNRPI